MSDIHVVEFGVASYNFEQDLNTMGYIPLFNSPVC